MNCGDDLDDLWNSQPPCANTKGDEIVRLVQRKTKRFERMIAIRNWTECMAAAVVVVSFGGLAIRITDPIARIGALIVAAGAAWIAYYIIRRGNAPVTVDPSQNLTVYTRALLAHYDYQIKLLKSTKYWYLLPMYIGLLVMSAGGLLQTAKSARLSWWNLGEPAFYTAVFAAVWWLNEVNAVKRLRRQREKLLSMIDEANTSNT